MIAPPARVDPWIYVVRLAEERRLRVGNQSVEVLIQIKETLRAEQAAQEEEPAIVGLLRPRGHGLGGE